MLHPCLSLAAVSLLLAACSASGPHGNRMQKVHPAGNPTPIMLDDFRALANAKPLRGKAVQVTFRGLAANGETAVPTVHVRFGQRAVVEVIREFRYPSSFDLPLEKARGGIVTPTTPEEFETRNTGITIDFEAKLRSPFVVLKGTVIECQFEGFIQNAGDVFRPIAGKDGRLITPNRVNTPAFTTRETPFFAVLQPGKAESFKVNTERGFRTVTAVCSVTQ